MLQGIISWICLVHMNLLKLSHIYKILENKHSTKHRLCISLFLLQRYRTIRHNEHITCNPGLLAAPLMSNRAIG